MSKSFPLRALAAAGLFVPGFIGGAGTVPAHAEEGGMTSIPAITVYPLRSGPGAAPTAVSLDLEYDPPVLPYSDSADWLRTTPGVSAGRFGGHGLEPVIRGQSMTQLDIRIDGASIHGGCPNRMDPPTAYAALENFDSVTVVRGYQSVLNGPGAPGGGVFFERKPPVFMEGGPGYDISASGGYESNGNRRSASVDASTGERKGYARLYGAFRDSGNYRDGDGNTVRSAFTDESAGAAFGWTPDSLTRITIGYDANRVADALFAGASMDSPLSDADTFRAGFEKKIEGGIFRRIEASAQVAMVDHIMNNYSLRDPTPGNYSRANSESDTHGAKLRGDLDTGAVKTVLGLDFRGTQSDATRLRGADASGGQQVQSILWPDIGIDEAGVSAESVFPLGAAARLIGGARYDRVRVDYGRAGETTGLAPHTPNALYRQFYGIEAGPRTENNFGALARVEYDVASGLRLFSGISRSVRTADATERGIASRMVMGAVNSSWVGNPGIKPEKHHQIDAGVILKGKGWSVESTAYANFVQDYILKDSARGQDGILMTATSATVYRNIDAFLSGIETQARWRIGAGFDARGTLAFTYGRDRDLDRSLPQIPPVQGSLGIVWKGDAWEAGADMRWAARQGLVDTDRTTGTGRDVGKTPGYAVFDMNVSTRALRPFEISLGVSNLFDRRWADHLNRADLSDPGEIQVNEPGRSVFLRARVRF